MKIRAVFDLFDLNKDGNISMDEMFKFLSSVFKVVLTPQVLEKYTRNGWGRCETTLVSSGEDDKLHSFRVEKMINYTRFEWRR